MGRELKRVALDFNWPLHKVWEGFLNPYYQPCGSCKDGYSAAYTAVAKHINELMWDRAVQNTMDGAKITKALAGRSPGFIGFHDSTDAYSAIKRLGELAGLPETWLTCSVCCGSGVDPKVKESYDKWEPAEPPSGDGYQIWETVSEGSPISPVFSTPEELAEWMGRNDRDDSSKETWFKFITGPGWAPSFVMSNGQMKSGVESVTE
jgi:hypothetical protein